MSSTAAPPSEPPARGGMTRGMMSLIAVAMLVQVALFAYANSLRAPMHFDDRSSLMENPTIRTLWPLSVPLSPPSGYGLTVEGRPLLNLSLAVNYAIAGMDIRGYHITNVVIHVLAGLVLFGLIQRTLRLARWQGRYEAKALPLALLGAMFWTLHPLQTESVTYVIQRAESMAGLFILLALYGFVRSAEGDGIAGRGSGDAAAHTGHTRRFPWRWLLLAGVASWLGVATKETAVVLPLLVLLYDRTFLAGSFRGAWRQHRVAHLAIVSSWILLLVLVAKSGSRGGTFDLADPQAWWRYGLTQAVAVVRYVRLAFWPDPLIFDYGKFWVTFAEVIPQVAAVLLALGATVYGLLRRPWVGFVGAWFFITLAPSSVLPGTIQMIVEHRMYVPLVAITMVIVAVGTWLSVRAVVAVTVLLAVGFGLATHFRNETYGSEVALWTDTLEKRPDNARAVANLGSVLYSAGEVEKAEGMLRKAIRMDAANPEAHFNLGLVLMKKKLPAEAAGEFAEAARLKPVLAPAHLKRAVALWDQGRRDDAIAALQQAVVIWPDYAEAYYNLGQLLTDAGRPAEAGESFRRALAVQPDYGPAQAGLGLAVLRNGQVTEAIRMLQVVVKQHPKLALAHFNLALAYDEQGDADAARRHYAEAVRRDPEDGESRLNHGIALAKAGKLPEAKVELEHAVRLKPDSPEARQNLGIVLTELGEPAVAVAHYQEALRLRPNYAQAHYNFGNCLLALEKIPEARAQFAAAVAADPSFEQARDILARMDAALGRPSR